MNRDTKRPRLGRGLASLIQDSSQHDFGGQYVPAHATTSPAPAEPASAGAALEHAPLLTGGVVPIDNIETNPYQPRRAFDPQALNELAASIRTHGVLQPVLVTDLPHSGGSRRYRLIAGERRLRAAQLAGVASIPCIVRPAGGTDLLELALIENIHRTDLNPLERASAYRSMMDRFGLTQEQLADRVGGPRTTISNYLRMLDLPDLVQKCVLDNTLSFGHAKVLAGLAGRAAAQESLARKTVAMGLSVRQLESLANALQGGQGADAGLAKTQAAPKSAYLTDVERQLSQRVGTRVTIKAGRAKHSGRIVIEYYCLEDFDRIVASLGANIDS